VSYAGYSPPCDDGLDLVYQDDSILVANKPAGLLSVPGRGAEKSDCMVKRLQLKFPDALVVHRLDMSTSGLMMFARVVQIQRHLSQMFRERLVAKRYVAVVAGKLEPAIGEIDLPITVDWPNRPLRKIDAESGQPSLTRYRVMQYDGFMCPSVYQGMRSLDNTRVELEPVTGRTHQLRIHLAAIGHPILGDTLYGVTEASAERLLLHASEMSFAHPINGQLLSCVSTPPF